MSPFTQHLLDHVLPGMRVLDIGAGEGVHAKYFVEKGASVLGIDRSAPNPKINGVSWMTADASDFPWSKSGVFNIIVLRNLIQFLPKDFVLNQLLPELKTHLAPEGFLGIVTFTAAPIPPFEGSNHSYYSVKELKESLQDMRVIYETESVGDKNDRNGTQREFHLSEIIVQNLRS